MIHNEEASVISIIGDTHPCHLLNSHPVNVAPVAQGGLTFHGSWTSAQMLIEEWKQLFTSPRLPEWQWSCSRETQSSLWDHMYKSQATFSFYRWKKKGTEVHTTSKLPINKYHWLQENRFYLKRKKKSKSSYVFCWEAEEWVPYFLYLGGGVKKEFSLTVVSVLTSCCPVRKQFFISVGMYMGFIFIKG